MDTRERHRTLWLMLLALVVSALFIAANVPDFHHVEPRSRRAADAQADTGDATREPRAHLDDTSPSPGDAPALAADDPEPAFVPTGAYDVTVLSRDGDAVGGATVVAYHGSTVVRAVTDDDGHAHVALSTPGTWSLECSKAGVGIGVGAGHPIHRGGRAATTVFLEPPCSLRVRVLDVDDAPVAGRTVGVWFHVPSGTEPLRRGTTDEAGTVSFGDLPAGACGVDLIPAATEFPWGVWVALPAADEVVLRDRPSGHVAGVVRDAVTGDPIAGATVGSVSFGRGWDVDRSTLTDAEGRFAFAMFRSEVGAKHSHFASAPGHRPLFWGEDEGLLVPTGWTARRDIELERTGTVVVTVLEGDAPVPGLRLVVGGLDVGDLITDAEGRCVIDRASPGPTSIRAHGDDDLDLETDEIDVPESGTTSVTLLARRTSAGVVPDEPAAVRFTGSVLDRDGAPIAGAFLQSHRGAPARYLVRTPVREDGTFSVEVVPDTRIADTLFVCAPGFATREIDLALGRTDDPLHVVLDPATHVAGRVVDDAGNVVVGAFVRDDCHFTRTDAAGRFDIAAEDPPLRLTVSAEGHASVEVESEGLGDVVLTRIADVVGRVVFDDDTPAARCGVRLLDDFSGVTGPDGSFKVRACGGFEDFAFVWRLDDTSSPVAAGGYRVERVDATTMRVVVHRGGRIAGVLLDAKGAPVRGAGVHVVTDAEFVADGDGVTDDDGRFSIAGLALDADWRLEASDGLETLTRTGLRADRDTGLRLNFSPVTTLGGRLLGPDGRPLGGVDMRAQSASPDSYVWTRTGDDGAFTFDVIDGALYELSLSGLPKYLATPVGESTVRAGRTDVVLRAQFAAIIRGKLLDRDGGGVSRVAVRCRGGRSDVTGPDGSFEFTGFDGDDKPVSIDVGPSRPRADEPNVGLDDVAIGATDVRIGIDATCLVRGRLRGVHEARWVALVDGKWYAKARTDENGTFQVCWLAPGTVYEVKLYDADAKRWTVIGSARTGDERCEFDVDRGAEGGQPPR